MVEDKQLFQFEEKEPFYKRPTFLISFITLVFAVVLLLIFYKKEILGSMTAEEVGRSIQIVWHESHWVDKKLRPDEVAIVPFFKFKVKNVGQKPMKHASFQGVFILEENGENLSDGFAMALKTPLLPGQTSDEIFIKGAYGFSASSKAAFILNIQNWKRIKIKMYAKAMGSDYVLLGIYPISQDIEGTVVQTIAPQTPPPTANKK